MTLYHAGKAVGKTKLPAGREVNIIAELTSGYKISTFPDCQGLAPKTAITLKSMGEEMGGQTTPNASTAAAPAATPSPTPNQIETSLFNNQETAATAPTTPVVNKAQGQTTSPSVEEVNKALYLKCFAEGANLWEEDPETVAKRMHWLIASKASYDKSWWNGTSTKKKYSLGVRVTSYLMRAPHNKIAEVCVNFANKSEYCAGVPDEVHKFYEDQGLKAHDLHNKLHEGYADAIAEQGPALVKALENLFGKKGTRATLDKGTGFEEDGLRWDWNGAAFFAVHVPNEYVKLRILPPAAFDGIDYKTTYKASEPFLKSRVKKMPDGSVLITDLPFIMQGMRPWCVLSTFERMFRYRGIYLDMDRLAVGNTFEGGGGYADKIINTIKRLTQHAGIGVDYKTSKNDARFSQIKAQIDKGNPVFYSNPSHMSLIVGYNEQTKSVASASSDWGAYLEQQNIYKSADPTLTSIVWIPSKNFTEEVTQIGYLE